MSPSRRLCDERCDLDRTFRSILANFFPKFGCHGNSLGSLEITGSAVALHCCKAHSKINRKMGNSTPCKIVTPKIFNLKLCTRDYVGEATQHANFGSNHIQEL